MTDDDILARLTELFQDILDDDDIHLTRETTAADIKDWDSANHINLVVGTEMRFGVKFTNVDIEQPKNVGDFVALIQRKLAAKG